MFCFDFLLILLEPMPLRDIATMDYPTERFLDY
jgi:hypothetical protein